MKKNIFSAIFMAALMLFSSIAFTSCKQEEMETDPFKGVVAMAGYTPNPVARGGELCFIGTGLDKVTEVIFAGENVKVTEFVSKAADSLRVIVPKTAQPGVITLKAGDVTVTSRSQLAFTEPVGFAEKDALSGKNFMPGDTLTVKGSYLNLVKDVVFGGDAYSPVFACGNVTENEPMDMWLKVVIPAEAISGKIKLSFFATGSTDENLVPSTDEITIYTHEIDAATEIAAGVPGETYSVAGRNLELVTMLKSPAGDSIKFTVNKEGTELTFVVPDYITNGTIWAVSASEVGRAAFNFTLYFPADVTADKLTDLRGGDSIVLSGTHVELIQKVLFPTKSGYADAYVSATKKVAVPEQAYPGKMKVATMAAEAEVEMTIAMLHPTYTSHNKEIIASEETVTFVGTDLDLIAEIEIVGIGKSADYIVKNEKTSMDIFFPVGSKSGMLKATLVNGEVIDFAEVKMALPNGCYVPDATQLVTTDARPMQAGDVICIDVENIDRLVSVEIDGTEVTFIANPDKDNAQIGKLYINTPSQAKTDFELKLISDNDIQTYALTLIQSNARTKVIWEGEHVAGGWASGFQALAWGGYDWSTVKAGSILKVDFAIDPAREYDPAIRLGNGSWVTLPSAKTTYPEADGDGNIPCLDKTSVEIELTGADLNELQNNGGLVVCGAWFIVTRVRLTEFLPVETVLWEGEAIADGWGDQPFLLSDGGAELLAAGAAEGQDINFYIEPIREGDWKVQVVEGHWGPTYGSFCNVGCADTEDGKFVEYDLASKGGKLTLTLTQEMLDAAITQQWWGGGFLLNGDNVKCTAVTLK